MSRASLAGFYTGPRDLQSGSHVCTVNISSVESCLQTQFLISKQQILSTIKLLPTSFK